MLEESHTDGIVFGNSGGKDSALVGILCKYACENTLGIIMPCGSEQNFGKDYEHALLLSERFNIEYRVADLSGIFSSFKEELSKSFTLTPAGTANIAPRLRMTALYLAAACENRIVAGTGNKSEYYMGYFTKWGDGAYDFNPIADLSVTEVYEFLHYLGAPSEIINKAPSAGLFDGQSDEKEMGVTYKAIDRYMLCGEGEKEDIAIIERMHRNSRHKRKLPPAYGIRD